MKIVLCIDIDNDIGRKVGIEGPIIGLKNNEKVATKLLEVDPEDTDGNAIFGAIKLYKQIKGSKEIITVTGDKNETEAIFKVEKQLKYIKNKYKNPEFYIVSDGAEDESVLYLIKNYGKILGVKVITPRQIKSLEKIIYVFKELVKDKEIARYVFGIPGLILLLIGLFGDLGIKIVLALSGLFLIFYGFRIDEVVKENLKDILKSKHKILTVICFIMSIMFFIFWITSCYQYLESFIKEHYVEYLIAFYHNHLELLIISLLWLLLIRKINIYVIILLLFLDVSFMLYINSISIVQYFLIVLNLFVLGFIIDKVIKIINESLYKSFAI
jgi:putative membrane protein